MNFSSTNPWIRSASGTRFPASLNISGFSSTPQKAAFDGLRNRCEVQLCFKNPGHFIAYVTYDEDTDETIYNDPWPDRFPDGNGFTRRMIKQEYDSNVKGFAIIYNKP